MVLASLNWRLAKSLDFYGLLSQNDRASFLSRNTKLICDMKCNTDTDCLRNRYSHGFRGKYNCIVKSYSLQLSQPGDSGLEN